MKSAKVISGRVACTWLGLGPRKAPRLRQDSFRCLGIALWAKTLRKVAQEVQPHPEEGRSTLARERDACAGRPSLQ